MNTKHKRAKPMAPDDRRRAIADAIIPLLLDKGSAVTSRQMADAAGIAEGTIFRVFPDKPSVIIEAVKVSMDPAPVSAALADIPEIASLDDQLESAAVILLERSQRVVALVAVLRSVHTAESAPPSHARRVIAETNATILTAITRLFERHTNRLRVTPSQAAVAFRGLIFANAHPMVTPSEKTTAHEIVDLLLHGISTADQAVTD